MQPSYNPPGAKTNDVFGRRVKEGTLVAAAGVRELVIGHVYRMPDYSKSNVSIGVKSIVDRGKHSVNLGSTKYTANRGYIAMPRLLILDDSYLDL